jgi:glycosyltransferase involved in cell wall biosynthesis
VPYANRAHLMSPARASTRRQPGVLFLDENAAVPADRRVWNEALTLRDAGFRVSIVCPQWHYGRRFERLEGINIYRFPIPSLGGISGHLVEYTIATPILLLYSWFVFVRHGFDVIHAANPPDFLYLIGRVFKLLGKKFVFDQHDVVPETCVSRWSGITLRLTLAVARWTERASFRAADVVIAPNQSVRNIAVERGGVEPSRVFIVRNAIKREALRGGRVRSELRRGRRYLVCYAGLIGPNDGLEELVRAVHHIVVDRGRRDIHVVVMGDGDCLSAIRQLSLELGIGDAIEFTGWVSDDRVLADYLATADVCLAPDPKNAVNDLGSMNKIVEYMAMGKPVVAFDLKEARETAQEAGSFVPSDHGSDPAALGDRVLSLLDSPETRERMGRAGRQRFSEVLAWEHQQANLLQAYATLLGRPIARVSSIDAALMLTPRSRDRSRRTG